MKRIEQATVGMSIIGVLMKLFLFEEGNTVLGLSLTFLAIIYYPLGFFYFNSVPIAKIFDRKSYKEITILKGIGAFGAGVIFAILCVGVLFKLLQLPGASEMLIIGLTSGAILFVVILFKYRINKNSRYSRKILIRSIIWLPISSLLYLTPGLTLVKIFHRNDPEYIEAYERAAMSPSDEELWRKADEARKR
ncbi:MAG: hypothetical protein RJQ09_11625 [Cyclobacteriaceae bacterium]|uniref:GldL-related protein n=1 Tax=Imperialibacter sp. TaxID=2038411 RepID=UPI0032EE2C6B